MNTEQFNLFEFNLQGAYEIPVLRRVVTELQTNVTARALISFGREVEESIGFAVETRKIILISRHVQIDTNVVVEDVSMTMLISRDVGVKMQSAIQPGKFISLSRDVEISVFSISRLNKMTLIKRSVTVEIHGIFAAQKTILISRYVKVEVQGSVNFTKSSFISRDVEEAVFGVISLRKNTLITRDIWNRLNFRMLARGETIDNAFNMVQFNLGGERHSYDIPIRRRVEESINADTMLHVLLNFCRDINIGINADIDVGKKMPFKREVKNDIFMMSQGGRILFFSRRVYMVVNSSVDAWKIMGIARHVEIQLNAFAEIQKLLWFERGVGVDINANINVGKFISVVRDIQTNFSAEVIGHIAFPFSRDIEMTVNSTSEAWKIMWYGRRLNESIIAVVGARKTFLIRRAVNTIFDGYAEIRSLIPRSGLTEEHILGEAISRLIMWEKRHVKEAINAGVNVTKDMNFSRLNTSDINARVWVGIRIPFAPRNVRVQIRSAIVVGKSIPFERDIETFIANQVAIGTMEFVVAVINVEIPPGGEIRLDSNAFTAMMGNENIMHLYNGEWVFITRNTSRIKIEAMSGGKLAGEVLFNERYV